MVVYVELAFLQNFLLDGLLLWLALQSARVKISKKRLFFSAFLGGVFALIFPFLTLWEWALGILKIAVGLLLVLVSFGRIKGKNEWGRYAFTSVCFFGLTFVFAGGISAFWGEKASPWYAVLGFLLLTPAVFCLIKAFYAKKRREKYVYECKIIKNGKIFPLFGFFDSGNQAEKNGLPVCFLSPDTAFDIFGAEMLERGGQVCDEIAITTMSGEKKLPIYLGELEIEGRKKEVYFAISANMLSRGYKLLLHSRIFEEKTEKRGEKR